MIPLRLEMIKEEKFRKELLDVVDESMTEVFGEDATKLIYTFLEKEHHLRKEEIPRKPKEFSVALGKMLGSGAQVIERKILEKTCSKFGLKYRQKENYRFADSLSKLKKNFKTA